MEPPEPPEPYVPTIRPFAESQWAQQDPGNFFVGFLVGLIFGLLGLIVIYTIGLRESKRGALWGSLVRIGLTILALELL